jgi:hypothetical protein
MKGMNTSLSWLATLAMLAISACSAADRREGTEEPASNPPPPGDERDTEDAVYGGQSGNEGAAVPPPCVGAGETAVLARLDRLEAGCSELTVEQVLRDFSDTALAAGHRIGGATQRPFTNVPPSTGDLALATWSPPADTCQLYLDCSLSECGAPDDTAAWDACNGQCVESTRAQCDELRQQELNSGRNALGGTVRLARIDASGSALIDWRGATRAVSVDQVLAEDCPAYFGVLPAVERAVEANADVASSAPPPQPESAPMCPLPANGD